MDGPLCDRTASMQLTCAFSLIYPQVWVLSNFVLHMSPNLIKCRIQHLLMQLLCSCWKELFHPYYWLCLPTQKAEIWERSYRCQHCIHYNYCNFSHVLTSIGWDFLSLMISSGCHVFIHEKLCGLWGLTSAQESEAEEALVSLLCERLLLLLSDFSFLCLLWTYVKWQLLVTNSIIYTVQNSCLLHFPKDRV